jgi:hypothetical protein
MYAMLRSLTVCTVQAHRSPTGWGLNDRVVRPFVTAALVGLLLVGCGADESEPADADGSTPAAAEGGATKTVRVEKQDIDATTVGRLSGVVTVSGDVPAAAIIPLIDTYCVDHHSGGYEDERLLVSGGRLKNAFVWIKDGLDGFRVPEGTGTVELDQTGCVYAPRVIGFQLGQLIEAKNSDPVLHNVHTKPSINRAQNIASLPNQPPVPLKFKRPEVMIEVACDVHAWMKSWIGCLDHPFFAVTGEDGSFQLEGVPPGDYTLGVWHESLGEQEVAAHLEASGDVTLEGIVYQL